MIMRLRVAAGAIIIIIIGLYLYYLEDSPYVMRCPMKWVTGLSCPGCGAQRALHAVLHGNFKAAIEYNYFMLPGVIYVGLVFGIELLADKRVMALKRILVSRSAALLFMFVVVVWMIIRNIFQL